MDYPAGQTSPTVVLLILTVIRISCALLDRTVDASFPLQLNLHHIIPAEASQVFTSCDFESPCSWSMSNHSGNGDWYVVSPQQSWAAHWGVHTITDHSIGDSKGHFLVLRPGTALRASGICTFHIASPVVLSSGPRCHLHFACFQPEPRTGNLSVSIKLSDSAVLNALTPVSRGKAITRASWEILEVSIGKIDEPFHVIVEYTSCSGQDLGLLAIDSLELMDCNKENTVLDESVPDCEENSVFQCDLGGCIDKSKVCDFHSDCPLGEDEGFICDTLPLGSYCSFELSSCGWTVSDTQSSWSLASGEQLSRSAALLGTTLQHTQGQFLFLNIRGDTNGNEASVYSPTFPLTLSRQNCQLRFSLYLYGDFNGTVRLSVVENGSSVTPLVWKRAGHWKDNWQDVTLQITDLLNGFHLRVQALWAPVSEADIALDNISLSASCFDTDLKALLLGRQHDLDSISQLDVVSPLPEPSSLEVSQITWLFTSCGASGPRGPTQAQCDSAYRNTDVNVLVGKEGPLRGVQMWKVPATNRYKISAYGAAGGKGAKNHNKRSHGVIISAIFTLEKGDTLYLLIGHQGEDACPGRNPLTHKICLGESSVIEDRFEGDKSAAKWAGGGGGGGGATFIFRMENGEPVPLLIAAGGGGKAYLEDPESRLDQIPMEQYENDTVASGVNGRTGAAGGGGGWKDSTTHLWAGKSLFEGAEGGSPCPQALSKLSWVTFGGFGGGGGSCTAGGAGGGYRGGDVCQADDLTANGQDGISFVHPSGELFLQPLAVMESHGEAEIEVHLNCSHCQSQSCKRDKDSRFIICLCHNDENLAADNVSCIETQGSMVAGHPSMSLIVAVVASAVVTGVVLTCACLTLMYYRKKNHLQAVRLCLQSPEHKLSKIRSSIIMTDYNPNYCFAGKSASLCELKEVPRKNITLLRALGHGAFGEVYEGQVLGMNGDNTAMQVAIKTLPEICSEQDEMDFLMEALIMSKFNHQNIVSCIGVSLQILPRFILLELMTGGDMKSFLRQNRPRANQASFMTMLELLHMARDIAFGCRYLEENHFIHRDIAARNCLLTCSGPERVAKIGDFGMARDIYRASYYRKGGRAMLPVKWMPPEAFLEGIFTCKTDTWSFGVLLWEIFSLGYMPYPCKTNQEVLEFVTSGGRMDPPKSCPGPVYRIMTQCWQHCPEHRPNFSAILERINYCTQDPDVINTPLPIEYGPTADEESSTVIRPVAPGSLTPLLVSRTLDVPMVQPAIFTPLPQAQKPCLLLQQPSQLPEDVAGRDPLEPFWVEPPSGSGACASSWLQVPEHQPCSRSSSSSGSQKLKNNTKNLWNPTYGSWILESFGRTALSHTQSMPLSSTITALSHSTLTSEHDNSGNETNASPCSNSSPTPSHMSLSPEGPLSLTTQKGQAGAVGGSLTAVMDLAKLQNFPCGNVNYAYDEHSYEAEGLPIVVARSQKATSSSAASSSLTALGVSNTHKPLVKRHASYGHEDVRRHSKPEKPTRDRDSGFSLSEDLTVTPV